MDSENDNAITIIGINPTNNEVLNDIVLNIFRQLQTPIRFETDIKNFFHESPLAIVVEFVNLEKKMEFMYWKRTAGNKHVFFQKQCYRSTNNNSVRQLYDRILQKVKESFEKSSRRKKN